MPAASVLADELRLQDLIDEALRNNHEILLSTSRVTPARHRVPQAESLPDPTFTFGYTNEGFERYTLGEEQGAQWVFGVSQMFPFPGKLALQGEIAVRDSERLSDAYESARLQTIGRVKELYYDLFFAHKNIDLIRSRTALFARIEDAALARYSSGTGSQQEVLMAQTEKYMLLEKEEMLRQKIQTLEGELNAAVGRDIHAPLGRPPEPVPTLFSRDMDDSLKIGHANSPELKAIEKTIAAAESKVLLNRKEYYPDLTLSGYYAKRGGPFVDMWGLTASVNIPIYYRKKQRQAVLEAEAAGCVGGVTFESVADEKPLEDSFSITRNDLKYIFNDFQNRSELYKETGCIHSAALSDGRVIISFAEDIGRHNAVDKVIGYALLENIPFSGKILLASGRISSEISSKCSRWGIPVLATRTAPTDLAVEIAEKRGVTIVGFVRGSRFNVYTHPERIR